ncbi:PhzF family phenazine biosynthesis protein [Gilvimarinus sp. DA14]|uniref:PhzF family phenazine biosynthesis protein n=1 Tax=Gilvimarinus sp. DA14 TaxID=2956798 RepID=UPI0020B85A30|nr:PhzF family phenazine biosynthesis protein [Gilvimarinus sp. DA14]UTF60884.1 PhzF family phenazine biosynthesis protein [Gilvimarinus sp. DA14]
MPLACLSMTDEAFVCQSFCGPGATGNIHQIEAGVSLRRNCPTDIPLVQLSITKQGYRVDFWQNGRPVRRCGSGTIALAAYLYHRRTDGDFFHTRVHTHTGTIELGYDPLGPYYVDRALPQLPLRQPRLWSHLGNLRIIHGAYAGGRGEYCIALCQNRQELIAAKPRLHQFALYTGRALIAACKAGDSTHMRYFAPQYGQQEDAATGSASVQLAEFIYRLAGQTHLDIQQLSSQGGRIQCRRISPAMIKVRGQYRICSQ